MRTAGMTLSPFNAWVVLKGLETLSLRMKAQSEAALAVAQWLERQPAVARVYYPGLASHPQHALAMRQQIGAGRRGAVLRREAPTAPRRARAKAFHVIDSTRVLSIATNLGDTKTHDHPSGHHLARAAQRGAAPGRRHRPGHDPPGRGPGRMCDDIKDDLQRGLASL